MFFPPYHKIKSAMKRRAGLSCLIFWLPLLVPNSSLLADNGDLRLAYENNLLTISAQNVDLKNVLSEIADKTKIYVGFPSSLKKEVTINKRNISLKTVFQSLLIGLDYIIVYSGPNKHQAEVSKVFVFKPSKKSNLPTPSSNSERRIVSRINAYKRQIESLNKRLSKLDQNSKLGQRYLQRIRALEKNIERYEKRLR
jgi:hypothetical protein